MPLVATTTVANFSTSFPSVVDTGGKFATGVNDTSGKDTGGNLSPVSTTLGKLVEKLISGCRYLKVNLKAKIYIYDQSYYPKLSQQNY